MSRYMISLSIFLLALTSMVALGPLCSFSAPPVNKVNVFMQAKLAHAQGVLEGLAREDYELIDKNAQQLGLLTEDITWKVLQTPDYLRHSLEFRRATKSLSEAANKKNLDGAALAYFNMTMKCVDCHKHVRDVAMANR